MGLRSLRRRAVPIFRIVAFFAVCLWGSGRLSSAAQREWTGAATPGPDGFFETAGNWALSLPPTLDDQAVFGIASPYTVTLASSPTLSGTSFNAGHVTFVSSTLARRQVTTLLGWSQSGGHATLDNIDLNVGADATLQGTSSLHLPAANLSVMGSLLIGSTTAGEAVVEIGGPAGMARLEVLGVTRVGDIGGGSGTLRLMEGVEGSFSSVLAVGSAGAGRMEVMSGSRATLDGTLLVAAQFGHAGSGKLVIDGVGSLFDIEGAGEAAIGVAGRSAEVQITGGGYFSTGTGLTHVASGSQLLFDAGEGVVEGALSMEGHLELTGAGKLATVGLAMLDSTVLVREGSQLTLSSANAASGVGATANISVEGAGSRVDTIGALRVVRSGQLNVSNGARLTASTIALGTAGSSQVEANIVGAGAKLSAGHIVLGGDYSGGLPVAGGIATLAVGFDGILEYTGSLHILGNSHLALDGGELRAPSFSTLSDPRFAFEAGTYTVMGSATIGAAVVAGLPTGSLDFGRAIAVEGTATLGAPLKLNGGKLAVGQLLGGGLLDFDSGTVAITGNAGLTIGAGGALGSTISLGNGSRLEVSNVLSVAASGHLVVAGGKVSAGDLNIHGQVELLGPTSEIDATALLNHGQVSGEGRLMGGAVTNAQAGVIAIANGRQLRLGGTGHTNAGRIELAAGRLEVDGQLTNLASGDIVGRGTLSFGEGLINQGDLILAAGATDIFGDVNNTTTAKVLISGGAEVVFWDDVTHNGTTFNVSAGSKVTFFGQAGFSVSGSGEVYFEEDISPGSSPGLAEFGGDVHFGGGAHLLMELGGPAPGTQYDTISIADTAYLGGELTVQLIDGFTPQVGNQFVLVNAEQRDGTFAKVNLPYIGAGRAFTSHYDATSMWLSVVATDPGNLLAGDYNDDGIVDAADYLVWRNHVGTSFNLANDEIGGTVGAAHYTQWKQNFGARYEAALVAASTPVPEPSTLAIIPLLVAVLLASHRAAGRPCRSRRLAD